MNLAKCGKHIAKFVTRNASTILFGIGMGLTGATVVYAVVKTPDAQKDISDAEAEKGEELTKAEKLKVGLKAYRGPIITGVAAGSCLIGSKVIDIRTIKDIATTAALSEKAYTALSQKVDEMVEPEKAAEIKRASAEERSKYDYPKRGGINPCDIPTKYLCKDLLTGQWLWSNEDEIFDIQQRLNEDIMDTMSDDGVSVNRYCEALKISTTLDGDYRGWARLKTGEICFNTYPCQDVEGRPYVAIEVSPNPVFDHDRWNY